MKIFYISLICLYCFSKSLIAQEEIPRYPVYFLFEQCFTRYPKAIKVHCKKYNYFEIFQEWDKYYDYSKDSLNLTIRAPWGKQYIKYNPDKIMMSFSSPVNNLNETYTYDEDGKLIKVELRDNDDNLLGYSIYSYTKSTITKIYYQYSKIFNKYFPSDKETVEFCVDHNKRYFCRYNIELDKWSDKSLSIDILDSEGRIIGLGKYDMNGKLKLDKLYYSYTDNGYIDYGNSLYSLYVPLNFSQVILNGDSLIIFNLNI